MDNVAASLEPFVAGDMLSLAERAYRRLRDAIVEGRLAPGARISERALGQSLGISAQPVREALQRLEADGMVVSQPRRGTLVAAFDDRMLAEMNLIRVALEGSAAALAARNARPEELQALREQLRAMRDATRRGDLSGLAEANERFHAQLRRAAHNPFLERSLDTLWAYARVSRLRALRSSGQEPQQALREHAAVLAALRRRDPGLAEARMLAHVRRSLAVGGIALGENLTSDKEATWSRPRSARR